MADRKFISWQLDPEGSWSKTHIEASEHKTLCGLRIPGGGEVFQLDLHGPVECKHCEAKASSALENIGTPLSELPAPVREKIAKLLGDCAPVRWIDPSPSPNGAGRYKRPLTWVRIGHGEDKLTGYWLRDDTGAVVDSRIIQ